MGVFSGSTPAREARDFGTAGQVIPSNGSSASETFGSIGADVALTLSTVWACVRLRAELVSTFPVGVFRMNDGLKVPMRIPKQLQFPGGERCDIHEWLYESQVSLDLRGNAYGMIVARDGLGYPTQIELVHPDMVVLYRDLSSGEIVCKIGGKDFPYADLWHERSYSMPGMVTGLSPVAYAARTMGVSLGAEKFGSDFFRDGATPSAVFTSDQPIDSTQAKTLKGRILNALRNNREPLILGAGLKYQAIQVAPEESQFLATLDSGDRRACQFFNVDPELVGVAGSAGSSVTYANREQRSLDFLTYRLTPTLVRRETALSKMVPGPGFVKFNTDSLLRTDLETHAKVWATRIASKAFTPDEERHDLDYAPLTDEQKALLDLVPLELTAAGMPKAVQIAPTPAPAAE